VIVLYVTPGGFPVLERAGVPVWLARLETRLVGALTRGPDRCWQLYELEDAMWGSALKSPDDAFGVIKTLINRIRAKSAHGVIAAASGPGGSRSTPRGWRIGPTVQIIRYEPGVTPAGDAP
jgi:hypothetical protein